MEQSNSYQRRLIGAALAAVLLSLLLFGLPFAALSDDTLFEPVVDAPALATTSADAARRARVVRVNWNALDPGARELRLNLFDNLDLVAELNRVDTSVTGGYVWVGNILGEAGGVVTLAVHEGVLSGSIHRNGREWGLIQFVGEAADDLYTIVELDPTVPQPAGQDHIVPQLSSSQMEALAPQSASCQEDGSEISLMVAYTGQARDTAGGQEAIVALINRRISEMNTANDVSRASFDWRLASVLPVDYAESGNIALDLQNLQEKADGVMDGVHAARDASKADLVALLISEGSNSACGYAYQLNSMGTFFESYAFGVTALDYADPFSCSELTLTHELGHNLGNAHDRAHASGAVLFPYSYGYQSPNGAFRTLMAYDCPGGCPRINQWANPDVWYQGEPTGVDFEADPAGASDVVRSMNQARLLVSNFRADCVEPTPTATMTPTDVPIATDTPTATAIPDNTDTPTPTVPPTSTNTPTPSITPTGTQPTPTKTLRPTATPRPTRTQVPTATSEPTPTSEATTPAAHSLYLPTIVRN
jgi:hypothetical protein